MPTLQIGRKEIHYELRRSATASERRITVTPGHVDVLALARDNDDDIAGFLARKRQWVFNTVRDMERVMAGRHAVPRFMTGSKIPFRGRRMPLVVRRTDGATLDISYRNGFFVDLPTWLEGDADGLIARELKLWLRSRARREALNVARHYREKFDLTPSSIQITDLLEGWGSCGAKGNITLNWTLIFAPKAVFDYVLVHELAHLRERSHGPKFWDYMTALMPAYERAKSWLETNQHGLSAEFLNMGDKRNDPLPPT